MSKSIYRLSSNFNTIYVVILETSFTVMLSACNPLHQDTFHRKEIQVNLEIRITKIYCKFPSGNKMHKNYFLYYARDSGGLLLLVQYYVDNDSIFGSVWGALLVMPAV